MQPLLHTVDTYIILTIKTSLDFASIQEIPYHLYSWYVLSCVSMHASMYTISGFISRNKTIQKPHTKKVPTKQLLLDTT